VDRINDSAARQCCEQISHRKGDRDAFLPFGWHGFGLLICCAMK